jgi:hypothetical protein
LIAWFGDKLHIHRNLDEALRLAEAIDNDATSSLLKAVLSLLQGSGAFRQGVRQKGGLPASLSKPAPRVVAAEGGRRQQKQMEKVKPNSVNEENRRG